MTTANILTQALQLMGTTGTEAGLSKLQTGTATGTGFGQVMSDSLKNQQGNGKSNVETVKQTTSPGKQFASKPVADTKDVTAADGRDKITVETVKAVEDGIKELVKEELGLTDEELEIAMQTLGLTYLELLQPENMKALLLEVNDAEPIDLLTNEGLNSQLEELITGTEAVLVETGIEVPDADELKHLVADMQEVKAAAETEEKISQPVETPVEENQPKVEILVEKPKTAKPAEKETKKQDEVKESEPETVSEKPEEETYISERKTETNTKDTENRREKGRNSMPEEQAVNPMEDILKNLSSQLPVDEIPMTAADRLELMRDIVNQVLDQIRINIRPDSTSMELILNPEHLGKINLTVVSRDGHLTASFTAQNEVTREALESQVQVLKENLSSQGIKVDAIEVNIQSFAFDERNQMNGGQESSGQPQSKGKRLTAEDIARAFGEDADMEEEVLDTVAITQSGANVDYTA